MYLRQICSGEQEPEQLSLVDVALQNLPTKDT